MVNSSSEAASRDYHGTPFSGGDMSCSDASVDHWTHSSSLIYAPMPHI